MKSNEKKQNLNKKKQITDVNIGLYAGAEEGKKWLMYNRLI